MRVRNRSSITLVVLVVLFSVAACSDGTPPDELIHQDWNSYWTTHDGADYCSEFLRLADLAVLGKRVAGEEAIVLVEANAEWVNQSSYSPSFSDSIPCYGFQRSGGRQQTQERKLHYEKYDTGWRLASVESSYYGRVVRHPVAR